MRNRKPPKNLRIKEPKITPEGHDTDDNDTGIEEAFASGLHELMSLGTLVKDHYLVDAAALLEMAKDKPDFLIPDLIPSHSVLMMAGKPGTKKSWVAYSLLLALVQDKPWFDVRPEPSKRRRRALVLNFDNPASELGRRFKRLGLRADDHIHFHSVGLELPPRNMPALLQLPLCIEPVTAVVYALQPDLVLIDSLRQAHTGDESSSDDMGRIMSCMRQLTHWGASVLLLHHTRKGPADGEDDDIDSTRGSGAISAGLDGLIIVKDDQLRWKKTRLWEPAVSTRRFAVNDYGDETRVETPDAVAAKVLTAIRIEGGDVGVSRDDLCEVLGMTKLEAAPHLAVLVTRGCVELTRVRVDGKQMRKFRYLKDLSQ
jgi:hypothetical protein